MRENNQKYDRRENIIADSHGFTLVELIVVLVIIAILAAATGPALLGYIDKAKQNETLNNAKKMYMSAQTLADQAHTDLVDPRTRITAEKMSEITLIDIMPGSEPYTIRYKANSYNSTNPTNAMYVIDEFTYDEGGFRATYIRDTGTWDVSEIDNES